MNRYIKTTAVIARACLALVVLSWPFSTTARHRPLQAQRITPEVPPEVKDHLRQIAAALPHDSNLRHALEYGAHGDGIHYQWMDEMKRAGIRRVKLEVRLTWFFGPKSLKVARVMYFTAYDTPASQITDTRSLESLQASGLEEKLRGVALQRGVHGSWFEIPPHMHPSRWGPVPAIIWVHLFDDEWLTIFPSLYGIADTSMSPLVQAVAAGDRFSIKKLLSEGKHGEAELNNALKWAAAGEDPDTVRDLLAAGAKVNAADKSGFTALMTAVINRRIAAVTILLDANADRSLKNKNGETALSIASRQKQTEIVELLTH